MREPCMIRRLRATGAAALAMGATLSVATAYVLTGSLDTPVSLPLAGRIEMAVVAPEGWKFFTKNPHDERLWLLRREEGGWQSASRGTNAEPSNLFGMSRDGRTQPAEAAMLVQQLPDSAWQSCDSATASCLESMRSTTTLRNPSPDPGLCGTIGLVLQKPVPWEWSRLPRPVVMPSRVTRVEVQC
jgi:antimicrobial peptide system SdpA family protein